MSWAQGLTAQLISQAHQRGDQPIVRGRLVVEMLQRIEPVGVIASAHLHKASARNSCPVNPLQKGSVPCGDVTHHRHGMQVSVVFEGVRFPHVKGICSSHQDHIWRKAHGCRLDNALEGLQRCLMPRSDCMHSSGSSETCCLASPFACQAGTLMHLSSAHLARVTSRDVSEVLRRHPSVCMARMSWLRPSGVCEMS